MSEAPANQTKWYSLTAEAVAKQLQVDPAKGLAVYFADVHAPVRDSSRRAGLLELIGEDKVFPTIDAAVRFSETTASSTS